MVNLKFLQHKKHYYSQKLPIFTHLIYGIFIANVEDKNLREFAGEDKPPTGCASLHHHIK